MRFGKTGIALLAAAALVGSWLSTGRAAVPLIPSTPQYSEPSQIVGTLNFLISQINTFITPQSMAVPATPRNLLDNGGMQIQQRGTGTRTCGTTTVPPATAYAADRWGCNVNVTSGAGTLQVITTAANLPQAPLPTFNGAMLFYRTSGTLAQPQCVMQEIPTSRITPMAGQNVNLSFYAQGLAAMLAEQTTLNAYVFTGTGADEGLQSFTASPAVTPAFTGIASSQTAAFTITSSWARYSASFSLASTVTEAAVALCWTPTTGGTAGVTDGFRFTGVQLEPGSTASAFEFRSTRDELSDAQRYLTILTEPAAGVAVPVNGSSTSATANVMSYQFPVTMRVAPTFTALGTALGAGTWTLNCGAVNNALATTFIVTKTANTPSGASMTVTSSGSTAGFGCTLLGAGGGSILSWSADF
jgi:hypothetical protein